MSVQYYICGRMTEEQQCSKSPDISILKITESYEDAKKCAKESAEHQISEWNKDTSDYEYKMIDIDDGFAIYESKEFYSDTPYTHERYPNHMPLNYILFFVRKAPNPKINK
jgi:hypothetical protein